MTTGALVEHDDDVATNSNTSVFLNPPMATNLTHAHATDRSNLRAVASGEIDCYNRGVAVRNHTSIMTLAGPLVQQSLSTSW